MRPHDPPEPGSGSTRLAPGWRGARLALLAAALATGAARARAVDPPRPAPIDATVRRVVARAAPGVVRVEVEERRAGARPERRFFREAAAEGHEGGAGFVVRADGLVLTHGSLFDGDLPRVDVLTGAGRRLAATLLGRDLELDLALLRCDVGREPLVALELGESSSLAPGRLVLTLGNPFGIARDSRPSAALGVVRAIGPLDARDVLHRESVVFTDAAVNPGNEGGPLVDLDGRVVGLVGPLVRDRRSQAIAAYALPVDLWRGRLAQLERGGAPPRLGLLVVEEPEGLLVARTVPDGPAERAGVREGDRLTAVDRVPVATREELRRALEGRRPGAEVRLTLLREKILRDLAVRLGGSP